MSSKTPDSEALLPLIERGFFDALEAHRPGLTQQTKARLAELGPRVSHLVRTSLDEMHVGYTLLAVAGFEVLAPVDGEVIAMRIVDAALHAPMRAKILEGTAAMLDAAPDPFAALVSASKDRETSFFGESFDFRRPVDDDHGYVLEIHRCLYHQVVLACGRPELMPLLCRADTSWIDAVDPTRHHLKFVRPSTFVTASKCRMWFMRTDGDDAASHEAVHGP
ncbi:MAG: L-2-amino-thiazoline-4-carboxylic acid hydrolase [Myxococcales bacterium]|nr:L-2-amino-thiazoline-4-carboxylic acid hydrolase [Myxococcales bacterium]